MNKNIVESLGFFERSINMLNDYANDAIERYNTIMQNRYDGENIKSGIKAAYGNFLINGAKAVAIGTTGTAAAASTSTAIGIAGPTVAALPGPVAAGGTVAAGGAAAAATPAIACVLAFIGGLKFGEGLGKIGVGLWDKYVVGKRELEELDADVKELKGYCNKMYEALSETDKDLRNAKSKINESLEKIKNQDYKTKKSNVKRIESRAAEIDAILIDIGNFAKVINVTMSNLSQLS